MHVYIYAKKKCDQVFPAFKIEQG